MRFENKGLDYFELTIPNIEHVSPSCVKNVGKQEKWRKEKLLASHLMRKEWWAISSSGSGSGGPRSCSGRRCRGGGRRWRRVPCRLLLVEVRCGAGCGRRPNTRPPWLRPLVVLYGDWGLNRRRRASGQGSWWMRKVGASCEFMLKYVINCSAGCGRGVGLARFARPITV